MDLKVQGHHSKGPGEEEEGERRRTGFSPSPSSDSAFVSRSHFGSSRAFGLVFKVSRSFCSTFNVLLYSYPRVYDCSDMVVLTDHSTGRLHRVYGVVSLPLSLSALHRTCRPLTVADGYTHLRHFAFPSVRLKYCSQILLSKINHLLGTYGRLIDHAAYIVNARVFGLSSLTHQVGHLTFHWTTKCVSFIQVYGVVVLFLGRKIACTDTLD